MLSFLIQINDANNENKKTMELTRFHSKAAPSISVYQYLIRLTKYSSLEHSVLLSAVYYIDLLSSVYPEFTLNSLTVHRFLLTATAIASKGLCDSFCTNTHYSKVGGVQCSELNILENEFLERVQYRILPRDDNIDNCKAEFKLGNSILLSPNDSSTRGPNNGFNVLENYYKKIVQLVGNPSNSPDNTSTIFFKLDEMHTTQPSTLCDEKSNGLINTDEAQTLSFQRETMHSNKSFDVDNRKTGTDEALLSLTEKKTPDSTKAFANDNVSTPSVNFNYNMNTNISNLATNLPQKRNIKDDEHEACKDNEVIIHSNKKLANHYGA